MIVTEWSFYPMFCWFYRHKKKLQFPPNFGVVNPPVLWLWAWEPSGANPQSEDLPTRRPQQSRKAWRLGNLAKTWGTKTTESSGFQPRKMRLHQQTSGSDSYNKQHTWSGLATTENQPAQFAPFLISLWKTTLWMGVTPLFIEPSGKEH